MGKAQRLNRYPTEPYGQQLLTTNARLVGNQFDKNTSYRREKAVGDISNPGKFKEMEQTNAMVALGSMSLFGVLMGANWFVDAHPDADPDITAEVHRAFFEYLDRPWPVVARGMFKGVTYGFAPQEITTQLIDGILYPKNIELRPPNTIDINTIRRGEHGWFECTQKYYDLDGTLREAYFGDPQDPSKGWLLWVTFGDNANPLGQGFYRPIVAIHDRKVRALQIEYVAIEKVGLGVPVVYLREGVDPYVAGSPVSKEDYEETLDEIAAATSHEQGVLGVPSWVDRIDELYGESDSLERIIKVIDHTDVQILTYFGAQYAARGLMTAHGTNSANETDAITQGGYRQYYLDWITEQIQPIVDWFVIHNFGEQRYYPQIKGRHDRDLTPQDLINAMATARQSQLLKIDNSIRATVRNALHLDPEPEDIDKDEVKGGALLDTVGGIQGIIQIKDAVKKGLIDEQSANTIVKSFYRLDDKAAQDIIGKTDVIPPPTVRPDVNSIAQQAEQDDSDVTGVSAATDASLSACSHNAISFQAGVDDEKSGVKQAPRAGGKHQQRTGPGGRGLTRLEKCVNWKRIEFCFDSSEQSLLGLLMDSRQEIGRYFASALKGKNWQTQEELADLLLDIKVPSALKNRIQKSIEIELERIAQIAVQSIDAERARQSDAIAFQADFGGDDNKKRKSEAKRATNESIEDTRSQLASATLQIIGKNITRSEIFDLFNRSIEEITGQTAQQSATMASTKTFNEARQAHVESLVESGVDEPVAVWYSAILDNATCSECEAADNKHGEGTGSPIEYGSAEHAFFLPPYQNCLGGVRCRCILIYEWETEQPENEGDHRVVFE